MMETMVHEAFRPGQATAKWRPTSFELSGAEIGLIGPDDAAAILPGIDLWDFWPLARRDGKTVTVNGASFWFFLSAPRFPDPGQRHDAARIRLLRNSGSTWTDLGPVLAEGRSPGSREWAGSAVLADDGLTATLYFTAAGRPETPGSFEQRLFETTGRFDGRAITDWSDPIETLASDGYRYVAARELQGTPGAIKAFRDPAFFNDPATEITHLLFTASAGWDGDPHNGVVGQATRTASGWRLGEPLIEAVGVNNELERPHVQIFKDRYYLFFSTQRRTFADPEHAGPNGLYGFVADRFAGPWRPVNGSGLIAANPAREPTQAYSWWVTGDGRAMSFVDHWGMAGRTFDTNPELLRSQFGGTVAPAIDLKFDGDCVSIRR